MNSMIKEGIYMNKELLRESILNRVEESQLFTKRFASFNKSDYEVLMFTVYLDTIDGEPRDYDISIALGIPESKVRTLRVKSQLQYPRDIRWAEKLTTAIQHGTYGSVQKQITITIEDPSVRSRIRHEVESNFGTVNISLNSKQLVLPVESFLILAACTEEDPEAVIDKLNKELRRSKIEGIEKANFKGRFFKSVSDVESIISSLASAFTVGVGIINAVSVLIHN